MAIVSRTVSLTESQRQRIIEALTRLNALRPCTRCGEPQFHLLNEVFGNGSAMRGGWPSTTVVPTVAIACRNCGCLYHFMAANFLSLQEMGL